MPNLQQELHVSINKIAEVVCQIRECSVDPLNSPWLDYLIQCATNNS